MIKFAIYEAPQGSTDLITITDIIEISNELIACFPSHDIEVRPGLGVYVFCQVNKHHDRIGWLVLQKYDDLRLYQHSEILQRWKEYTDYPMSHAQDRLFGALMNASYTPPIKGQFSEKMLLTDFLNSYIKESLFRRQSGGIWRAILPTPETVRASQSS